jgi:hypothetical protein
MICDVTMETKVRSLPLNNATDTLLLNNVRKVGELVLSRTSCFICGLFQNYNTFFNSDKQMHTELS